MSMVILIRTLFYVIRYKYYKICQFLCFHLSQRLGSFVVCKGAWIATWRGERYLARMCEDCEHRKKEKQN